MNKEVLAALLREAYELGWAGARWDEGYSAKEPPRDFDDWLEEKLKES